MIFLERILLRLPRDLWGNVIISKAKISILVKMLIKPTLYDLEQVAGIPSGTNVFMKMADRY